MCDVISVAPPPPPPLGVYRATCSSRCKFQTPAVATTAAAAAAAAAGGGGVEGRGRVGLVEDGDEGGLRPRKVARLTAGGRWQEVGARGLGTTEWRGAAAGEGRRLEERRVVMTGSQLD